MELSLVIETFFSMHFKITLKMNFVMFQTHGSGSLKNRITDQLSV